MIFEGGKRNLSRNRLNISSGVERRCVDSFPSSGASCRTSGPDGQTVQFAPDKQAWGVHGKVNTARDVPGSCALFIRINSFKYAG